MSNFKKSPDLVKSLICFDKMSSSSCTNQKNTNDKDENKYFSFPNSCKYSIATLIEEKNKHFMDNYKTHKYWLNILLGGTDVHPNEENEDEGLEYTDEQTEKMRTIPKNFHEENPELFHKIKPADYEYATFIKKVNTNLH
jgi:hypothetical protein